MSQEVTYRKIEIDDLPSLFEVRIATWHNDRGGQELDELGISIQSVAAMLQESHQGWLCETNSQIVGFAIGDKSNGEMWVIAVLSEYEGYGIGKRLLNLVESWLFTEGWSEIWLTTDPDETMRAVGFYRHLGWQDWKMENGDRYMKKTITSPL